MRQTYIERLECIRHVPYDPDNHAMLNREASFSHRADHIEDGKVVLRFQFEYKLIEQEAGTEWGVVKGEGVTTITDDAIKAKPGEGEAEAPPHIGKVIEGALADDILLPISQVVHAMRLPVPLVLLPMQRQGDEEE